MKNQNESDRTVRLRGPAVTSDSAGTATRHLDLVVRQQITDVLVPESIITLEASHDVSSLVEAEPIIPVEPLVAVTTLKEATRRAAIEEELRRRLQDPLAEKGKWLGSVARGFSAYHAVPNNVPEISEFRLN